MLTKEKLDQILNDIYACDFKQPDLSNLVSEYRRIAAWEEKSFTEVEKVMTATTKLWDHIDQSKTFPDTTVQILERFAELLAENETLRQERDDAREWHGEHCAMGCTPSWEKEETNVNES